MIHIEKGEHRYIVTNDTGGREVAQTTDKLFKKLLMIFEGRCEDFTGAYGRVIIHRSHPETDEFLVRPVAETDIVHELAEMLEHIEALEAELGARRDDSEVLGQVVIATKEWHDNQGRVSWESMRRIYNIVEDYINVPEVTPYPATIREEIAETLHTLFMTMVQKRQLNGTLPGGKTLCVTYGELADASKEYLRDQADEILKVLRGAQQC